MGTILGIFVALLIVVFFIVLIKKPSKKYDPKSLQADYERAMVSYHIPYIEAVLERWGIEVGDNRDYIKLNQRLMTLKEHKAGRKWPRK